MEDNFSMGNKIRGGGFKVIPAHDIYCALYSYYYYISSTLDHQAIDPRGLGPLVRVLSHAILGTSIKE